MSTLAAPGQKSSVGENPHVPHDLRVITYEAIVAGARRHFLREATIDMEQLAHELAVSRATLYRAVDGRDRLLGDVLWSLAERTYEEARRAVTRRGVDAILEISHRFTESVTAAAPFRRFLEQEPQTAMRVLLTPAGGVHARAVALHREIFAEAFAGREDGLLGDLDTLAYLFRPASSSARTRRRTSAKPRIRASANSTGAAPAGRPGRRSPRRSGAMSRAGPSGPL